MSRCRSLVQGARAGASCGTSLAGLALLLFTMPAFGWGTNDLFAPSKAILVCGRGSPTDSMWPTFNFLSQHAYDALRYRGFAKRDILFLSPDTNQDVDRNGEMDDIDLISNSNSVEYAFTAWPTGAAQLLVVLIDHGSLGPPGSGPYLKLSESEYLYARQLDPWLDALQSNYNIEVTLVVEACYSGAFMAELGYDGPEQRTIITASTDAQMTYYPGSGLRSFSHAFFSGTLCGRTLLDSFEMGCDLMTNYQSPWLDDDGDLVYSQGVDGAYADDVILKGGFVSAAGIPQISAVAPAITLTGATATLWADVVSSAAVARVWAQIVPPDYQENPAWDLPEIDLQPSGGNHFEAAYGDFANLGAYAVVYRARDVAGNTAPPAARCVSRRARDERVILVAGGPTSDVRWVDITHLAAQAYEDLALRGIEGDSLCYLSPDPAHDVNGDGICDVDASATSSHLAAAITNWAAAADQLTVYFIGCRTNGDLRLDEQETVGLPALDAWLDEFQASNRLATVVLETSYAADAIPVCTPPTNRHRIVIGATATNQTPVWTNLYAQVSFTHYFLSLLKMDGCLGWAYIKARTHIINATGSYRQNPQMDCDGDGIPNTEEDCTYAQQQFIGTNYPAPDSLSLVCAWMPDTLLVRTNALTLWAADVEGEGISNVSCRIAPPGYDGTNGAAVVDLAWNAAADRFELDSGCFTSPGDYTVTFRATTSNGTYSAPVSSRISQLTDGYEADDASQWASVLPAGGTQQHTFDLAGDQDWIRLGLAPACSYSIRAIQQGTNVDAALDVYREEANGSLTPLFLNCNTNGPGLGLEEEKTFQPATAGVFCVRVRPADTSYFGVGSAYEVCAEASGSATVLVTAVDRLWPDRPPSNAAVVVDGVSTHFFGSAVSLDLGGLVGEGVHTMQVVAAGYLPCEHPSQPGAPADPGDGLYGNPRQVVVAAGVSAPLFAFWPMARAVGMTRDQWTEEYIADASIAFIGAGAPLSNDVYTGYPMHTEYASPWLSATDGSWPTNVHLPTVAWDLSVAHDGYLSNFVSQAAHDLEPGDVADLGTIYLTPLDLNSNKIADAWEDQFFGPGSNVVASEDSDEDGLDNWTEYRLGTDPADFDSKLVCDLESAAGPQGMTLAWPVSPGRTYQVLAADDLGGNAWDLVAGPWQAAAGQTEMIWADTNCLTLDRRQYRIEVILPPQ